MEGKEQKLDDQYMKTNGLPPKQGLYDPSFEHDACGVGFVVNVKGKKSHQIIRQAIQVLLNLDHRGACGCEANTGDGAGILIQTPHAFLKKVCATENIDLPAEGQYGAGLVYLPHDATARKECERIFGKIVAKEGRWTILRWERPRKIPSRSCATSSSSVIQS
jgi:glutamate synthase (ferredoxin)